MKEQCAMNKSTGAFYKTNTHKEIPKDGKYVPLAQNTQWKS